MPQNSPEDRVKVKNIIEEELKKYDLSVNDEVPFYLNRYEKQQVFDSNGQITYRDVPVTKEVTWNFKNGFFFMWGQEPYRINNGEIRTYKRFLADHCANHMIDYILTRRYRATKRQTEAGPLYDQTILGNISERNRLRNEIILGVEEWDKGNDIDLDRLLANEFGGNAEEVLTERRRNEDFSLEEIDQTEPVREVIKEVIEPSTDSELSKLRLEADQIGISYKNDTTAKELKALIVKEMA